MEMFCNVAREKGVKVLYTEASKIAKPFFESKGFQNFGENIVKMPNGQSLVNYSMRSKPLSCSKINTKMAPHRRQL